MFNLFFFFNAVSFGFTKIFLTLSAWQDTPVCCQISSHVEISIHHTNITSRLHEFRRGTRLAGRYHYFNVEIARYIDLRPMQIVFSLFTCTSIVLFLAFLSTTIFQILNAMSVVIFSLLGCCSIIVLFVFYLDFTFSNHFHLSDFITLLGGKWLKENEKKIYIYISLDIDRSFS